MRIVEILYTTIVTPIGYLRHKRYPVGLKTGCNVLARAMNKVLGDLEEMGFKAYFDNILIYNKSTRKKILN